MSKIKICGLKRIEDITFANELKPDYIGFVFAGTKRKIDYDTALKLKKHLDSDIVAVGVFVNEKIDFILSLVSAKIIDCVQLHGDEDKDYIDSLREKVKCPIIKAVRVRNRNEILEARKLGADYLLLDSYSEKEYGGSGHGFDKNLIPDDMDEYFLAGGLNEDNLKAVIEDNKPYAVDLSSAVETDGVKDYNKMKRIISIVRQ